MTRSRIRIGIGFGVFLVGIAGTGAFAQSLSITGFSTSAGHAGEQIEVYGAGFEQFAPPSAPRINTSGLTVNINPIYPAVIPPELRFGASDGPVATWSYARPGVLRATIPSGAVRGPLFFTRTLTSRTAGTARTVLATGPEFVPLTIMQFRNTYQYYAIKLELVSSHGYGSIDLLAQAGWRYMEYSSRGNGNVLTLDVPCDFYTLNVWLGTLHPNTLAPEPFFALSRWVSAVSGAQLDAGNARLTPQWLLDDAVWQASYRDNSGSHNARIEFQGANWTLFVDNNRRDAGTLIAQLWGNMSPSFAFQFGLSYGTTSVSCFPDFPQTLPSPLNTSAQWRQFNFQFAGMPMLTWRANVAAPIDLP